MCTHDQQQLTAAQQHWLHFATNPEECQTTIKHMTTVLKLALYQKPEFDEDIEAINWVFYLLECANDVNEDYIFQLIRLLREKDGAAPE